MNYELTHFDFFVGILGFSFGFEAAGFRTIGYSEIDEAASVVCAARLPGIPNLGCIKSLTGKRILETVGWPLVFTGGVPCQPASALGKMRGTSDERWLWPDYLRLVREVRPFGLVAENPPSILTLEDGGAWNGIVSELVALGYDCQWDVFPAVAFGAGHLRERLYLVATDAQGVGERESSDKAHSESNCRDSRGVFSGGGLFKTSLAPHTHCPRLQGHSGNEAANRGQEPRRPTAPPDLRSIRIDSETWWQTQSPVRPVVNGLPSGLVEAALRCVGNSVLPQIPFFIAQTLRAEIERRLK